VAGLCLDLLVMAFGGLYGGGRRTRRQAATVGKILV
jgi:hypothetical protein